MPRLLLGALLLVLASACQPRDPATAPATASSSPPADDGAPAGAGAALETERVTETERALGMIGRTDPALGARIAASELAHPRHGLGPKLRETLNALAGDGLDASQRSLLIRTTFDEDADLRRAFDAACPPGWSSLALAAVPEGKRPEVIATACKAHPAAAPTEGPPSIALAIPLAIAVEGVLKERGALAIEVRLARALMHMQQ